MVSRLLVDEDMPPNQAYSPIVSGLESSESFRQKQFIRLRDVSYKPSLFQGLKIRSDSEGFVAEYCDFFLVGFRGIVFDKRPVLSLALKATNIIARKLGLSGFLFTTRKRRIINKLVKKYSLDAVLLITFRPRSFVALATSKARNINVLLTDPITNFLDADYSDSYKKRASAVEKRLVACSNSFFVPETFTEFYKTRYQNFRIFPYKFPLIRHTFDQMAEISQLPIRRTNYVSFLHLGFIHRFRLSPLLEKIMCATGLDFRFD